MNVSIVCLSVLFNTLRAKKTRSPIPYMCPHTLPIKLILIVVKVHLAIKLLGSKQTNNFQQAYFNVYIFLNVVLAE